MADKMTIPTGFVGLGAAVLGAIGRIYVQWISPPPGSAGIEAAAQANVFVGGLSAILLVIGVIVGIIGAAKNSGRVAGVVGAILGALFAILIFARS